VGYGDDVILTTPKELYSKIDPFVVERIRSIVTSSSSASTGTGSGTDSAALTAVRDASILVVNHTAALNNERALTVSGALSKSDGGPGGYLTINLATPGSLTASTGNDASTNHTHAVTASANPGAAASLLKSASDGGLSLTKLTTPLIDTSTGGLSLSPSNGVVTVNNTLAATTKLQAPLLDTASGNLSLAPASGTTVVTGTLSATTAVQTPLINTSSGVDLTIAPSDDLILSPTVVVIMDTGTRIDTGDFVSGTVGWRVDYDGTGDFRRLFADELTVEVFISAYG